MDASVSQNNTQNSMRSAREWAENNARGFIGGPPTPRITTGTGGGGEPVRPHKEEVVIVH